MAAMLRYNLGARMRKGIKGLGLVGFGLLLGFILVDAQTLTPTGPEEQDPPQPTAEMRQHIQDSLQLHYEEKLLTQMDSLEQLFERRQQIFLNKYDTERALYSEKIQGLIDSIKALNEKLSPADKGPSRSDSLYEARYFGYIEGLKTVRKQKRRLFWKVKLATEAVLPFQLQEMEQYQALFFPGGHCDYAQDYITQLHIRHSNWAAAEYSLLKFIYLYPYSPIHAQVKKIRTGIIHTERYYKDHRKALLDAMGRASQKPALSQRYFEFLQCLRQFPHEPVARHFTAEAENYLRYYPRSDHAPLLTIWIAEQYAQQGNSQKAFLTYEKLKSLYPDCAQYAQALYRQIELQVDQFGQYEEAIALCEQFLHKFSQDSLALPVTFQKARIYDVYLHNWEKALVAYQDFANTYPQSNRAVASLRRKARILAEELSMVKDAVDVYRDIEKRYAGTEAAQRAVLRAGDLLVRHGNYQKAIAQYGYLIENYPQASATLQALQQSAEIYQKHLQNTAEAVRMWELVLENFHDSKAADKARKALKKASPSEAETDE